MRRVLIAGLATITLVACADNGPSSQPTSTTATSPSSTLPTGDTTDSTLAKVGTLGSVALSTVEVAELDEPIALAARPGSPDLYIAQKGGRVRLIKVTSTTTGTSTTKLTYQVQTTPLLDISRDVINDGEQGLLGMAFSTDGRKVYLDYTRQPDGATVVVEYELGDRTTIDARSRRELLTIPQPFTNHNGGQLVFGPDGYLYVGLGDGGAGGDPNGNGQDRTTLLGSILRIDPSAEGAAGDPYAVPPGNPFADGADGAPEVWLYGVRNPWRFSFDSLTGDLWIGDVGQNAYEEVDRLPANAGFDAGKGANLGWNQMEGTHGYEGGKNPPGAVLPIFDYGRDNGCSVIGGYVYRGDKIPALAGVYLFADNCRPGIRGLQLDGDRLIDTRVWELPAEGVYSLGQDDAGELYVLLGTGAVLKITAA